LKKSAEGRPALVILAAGIGSRYGGLKQIDPVGEHGELIIDYSIYDAVKAGFEKVVFIITREIENDFMEVIGDRIAKYVETAYAYQELNLLPTGYAVPDGRVRPWGTAQALLSARSVVDGPFAVINADDFYGASAYRSIYDWLAVSAGAAGGEERDKSQFAMVGYRIENTVSDYGKVTRGICEADGDGFLKSIVERTAIEKTQTGARYSDDNGGTWHDIPAGTLVSMNFWGLHEFFFEAAEADFPAFLDKNLTADPLKCEYLLPSEIGFQLQSGRSSVKVLESADMWYGLTYKKDRPGVVEAIENLHRQGIYPKPLWK
jgi:choline kinase